MSSPAAKRAPSLLALLDEALDCGTDHQRTVALCDWIQEALLVREEMPLTKEVARDRAAFIAIGLNELLRGRLI
jgi:hypothetical protein